MIEKLLKTGKEVYIVKFFSNLNLLSKMMISAIIGVICVAAVGAFSFSNMASTTNNMEKINEEEYIPSRWVSEAVEFNQRLDAVLLEMMLINDLEKKKQLHNEINKGIDEVLSNFAKFEAMDLSHEERVLIEDFYTAVSKFEHAQEEVMQLASQNKNEEAFAIYSASVQQPRKDLIDALLAINDIKIGKVTTIINDSVEDGRDTARTLVFIFIFATIALVASVYLLSKSILRPIKMLLTHLEQAKNGDLTSRASYNAKNEMGLLTTAYNETLDSITQVLHETKQTAFEVDAVSNELASSVDESTKSIEHVVNSIQEIATSNEQTEKSIQHTTEIVEKVKADIFTIENRLNEVSDLAQQNFSHSEEGSHIITENVAQMKNIASSVQLSNDRVSTLVDKTTQINTVLDTITAISAQTNLLALNAAIEAARAGEHGKGFAVVADEVRKLAEQSLQATKSINDIIQEIQRDGVETVEVMSTVNIETLEGLKKSEMTAEKFAEIMNLTLAVAPKMEGVNEALSKMIDEFKVLDDGSKQILVMATNNATAAESVTAVAEQQAATMEEISNSTTNLAKTANDLSQTIERFKL
ncbi:MAG: methyl-accepting chemotaxis protein [Lysinibacillus sp.]